MSADRPRVRRNGCGHQFCWRAIDLGSEIAVLPKTATAIATAGSAIEAACPYCGSTNVTTSAKKSPDAYWRCVACGQMWHPDRVASRAGTWNSR